MSLSDSQQVVSNENKIAVNDDDEFHAWNVAVLDQCGSDIYIRNQGQSRYSESFKVLYEPKQKEGSDKFVRMYGDDNEPGNSQKDIDDEFKPFKTGVLRFDEMMSGKGKGLELKPDVNHKQDIPDADQISENTRSASGNIESADGNADGESVRTENAQADSAASLADSTAKRIFEDAYKNGFETGKTKGYEDGLTRGMEDGFKDGQEKGAQEGYDAGFQKGEQEGYDAGFQKGEEDGRLVSDAKALEIITSLEDILQKAEHSWQNSVKTHEAKLISLICRITEKIVFARVELDEGIVKGSILSALATMPEPEEIILNISPDDYDYVEIIKDDFFEHVNSLKSVSVISNPSVQRGGCKIESSKGKVETDIKTRLEQVFTSVMGARVS